MNPLVAPAVAGDLAEVSGLFFQLPDSRMLGRMLESAQPALTSKEIEIVRKVAIRHENSRALEILNVYELGLALGSTPDFGSQATDSDGGLRL